MPWYKFTAQHGPGHQSSREEYVYEYEELDDELKRDLWDDWMRRYDFTAHAVGDVELIEELPTPIYDRLYDKYLDRIRRSKEMLRILEATPKVYRRTYGPDGRLEDITKCIEAVDISKTTFMQMIRQCKSDRGYGKDGLYCIEHSQGAVDVRS